MLDEWRRGWGSNPRTLAGQRFSRPPLSAAQPPLPYSRVRPMVQEHAGRHPEVLPIQVTRYEVPYCPALPKSPQLGALRRRVCDAYARFPWAGGFRALGCSRHKDRWRSDRHFAQDPVMDTVNTSAFTQKKRHCCRLFFGAIPGSVRFRYFCRWQRPHPTGVPLGMTASAGGSPRFMAAHAGRLPLLSLHNTVRSSAVRESTVPLRLAP